MHPQSGALAPACRLLPGEQPYPGGSAGSHWPERQQILIATRLRPRFLLAHVSGQAMTGTFQAWGMPT